MDGRCDFSMPPEVPLGGIKTFLPKRGINNNCMYFH